jgi:hypothetical protein
MEHVPAEPDTEAEYDARVTHIMDTRGLSYDEAEQIAGPPPYEKAEVTTPPAPVQRRMGSRAIQQPTPHRRGGTSRGPGGEEEGTGYDNGEPFYFQPASTLADIDADKVHRNVAAIKQMLADQRRARSGRQ